MSNFKKIMELVIDAMQDQSSASKRWEALRCLGRIVFRTGKVIKHFKEYPKLLTLILNIIKTENSKEIREEAVKIIGILGAIDPHLHRRNQLKLKTERKAITIISEGKKSIPNSYDALHSYSGIARSVSNKSTSVIEIYELNPSSEEFYPTCAINTPLRVLKNPSLSVHHNQVIESFMFMFKGIWT